MRHYVTYGFLLALKWLSRLFYRFERSWVGNPPRDKWKRHRLIAFLHHTSLWEPLLLGAAPDRLLRALAFHGVLPTADKTIERPVVGRLYRFLAAHVVPISRARDQTWFQVLKKIDPDSTVVIAPEGRMMRRNGLDSQGNPMTVRGGIADVLEAIGEGRMLVVYSGGLHHVQVPGEGLPRLFRTIRLRLELVDIADYVRTLREGRPPEEFRRAVCRDLERRREEHCPVEGPKPWPAAEPGAPTAPS